MIIHQFLAIKDISLLFESGFAGSRLIFLDIIFPISSYPIFSFRYYFSGFSGKRYNLKNRKNWIIHAVWLHCLAFIREKHKTL